MSVLQDLAFLVKCYYQCEKYRSVSCKPNGPMKSQSVRKTTPKFQAKPMLSVVPVRIILLSFVKTEEVVALAVEVIKLAVGESTMESTHIT